MARDLTLDEFIALSEEMSALVRAGVPLERGLFQLSRDLPGTLSRVSKELAARMEQGQTLSQALEDEQVKLPRAYEVIVQAGLRSGRLDAALAAVAATARRLADTRRAIATALIYPLAVLLFAYVLVLAFFGYVVPELERTFDAFDIWGQEIMVRLNAFGSYMPYWGPVLPAIVAVAALLWLQIGRAPLLEKNWRTRILGWIPGVRKLLNDTRMTTLAEMLSVLIENEVPLPDALRLATQATGDSQTAENGRQLAEAAERGEPLEEALKRHPLFPPLVNWLVAGGQSREQLADALRNAAEIYRQRVLRRRDFIRFFLPAFFTFLFGVTSALLIVAAVFWPMFLIWSGLSEAGYK